MLRVPGVTGGGAGVTRGSTGVTGGGTGVTGWCWGGSGAVGAALQWQQPLVESVWDRGTRGFQMVPAPNLVAFGDSRSREPPRTGCCTPWIGIFHPIGFKLFTPSVGSFTFTEFTKFTEFTLPHFQAHQKHSSIAKGAQGGGCPHTLTEVGPCVTALPRGHPTDVTPLMSPH